METGTVNFCARILQATPANFLPSLEVKVYDERGKEQRCDEELVLAEILMLKPCLKLFWQGLYSSTDRIIAQGW